jgi:hypothetical protein
MRLGESLELGLHDGIGVTAIPADYIGRDMVRIRYRCGQLSGLLSSPDPPHRLADFSLHPNPQ